MQREVLVLFADPVPDTPYNYTITMSLYCAFRASGPNVYVETQQNPAYQMTQELFDEIKHPGIAFATEVSRDLIFYYYL